MSDEAVTGAIPCGPITDATEMIFVAGRAFVEASRHEQATGALAAERDALRAQLDAERGLRQATRTALGGLVVTLTAERDAARADVDTLLEAIATFGAALEDEGGASTLALYAAADTIAARRKDAS